jgi:hypothetical protein
MTAATLFVALSGSNSWTYSYETKSMKQQKQSRASSLVCGLDKTKLGRFRKKAVGNCETYEKIDKNNSRNRVSSFMCVD